MLNSRALRLACLVPVAVCLLLAQPALAGPPYVTDDPEPTDTGHWEIYSFAAGEAVDRNWDGAAGLDLNYGPVRDVQLTATLPIAFSHEAGAATRSGAGDVELAVKYRFAHQDREGIDLAIFPRLILPTGGHRFGSGRVRLLLPVWAGKDFGSWSVFGGGGYTINPGAGNRDFLQGGLAVTHDVSKCLSLGAEATVEGPDEVGAHATAGIGLGGIYRLGGPFSLLMSGGPVHQHHGPSGWRGYAALGLAF